MRSSGSLGRAQLLVMCADSSQSAHAADAGHDLLEQRGSATDRRRRGGSGEHEQITHDLGARSVPRVVGLTGGDLLENAFVARSSSRGRGLHAAGVQLVRDAATNCRGGKLSDRGEDYASLAPASTFHAASGRGYEHGAERLTVISRRSVRAPEGREHGSTTHGLGARRRGDRRIDRGRQPERRSSPTHRQVDGRETARGAASLASQRLRWRE